MNSQRQMERNKAYSSAASEYKSFFINELQKKSLDRKLFDLFYDKVVNRGKVLEIGCGPGEISNYLWMKGLDITGIDYSAEMINTAKEFNSSIDYKVGDVFNLDYENETIAGIAAPFLIVNFDADEVAEAFKEINRVLIQNGVFLVTFHIGNDETSVYENFLNKGKKISFTFFKLETIKRILNETGFQITETVIKEPYEGEVKVRSFIFAEKRALQKY